MIEHRSVHYDGAGTIMKVHRKPFKFVSMFDAWAKGGKERVTGEGLEGAETVVGEVEKLPCHAQVKGGVLKARVARHAFFIKVK